MNSAIIGNIASVRDRVFNANNDAVWNYRVFTRAAGIFNIRSSFSELPVETDAITMDVVCGTSSGTSSIFPQFGIYVNNVLQQTVSNAGETGSKVTKTITLPAGVKQISLILAVQNLDTVGGTTLLGQVIDSITVPAGNYITSRLKAKKSKSAVFFGDSITVGFSVSVAVEKAFIMNIRRDSRMAAYDVASYGWGNNNVATMFATAPLRAAIIADLVAYYSGVTDKLLVMELGTNDFAANIQLVNYTTFLGSFYDELVAVIPDIKVLNITPFPRTTENTANGRGLVLNDYRNGMIGVSNARTYSSYINGPDIVAVTDTFSDGVHFGDFGNLKMSEYIIRNILGIAQKVPFAPNGQFMQSATNSTGFVTIPNNATVTTVGRATLTIIGLVKRNRGSNNDNFISQGVGTTALIIGYTNANEIRVGTLGSFKTWDISMVPIDIGVWHHWAITKVGTTYEFYLDGYLMSTFTAGNNTLAANILIGAYGTTYANIGIDRCRLWSRKLSAAEIEADKYVTGLTDFTNVMAEYLMEGNANDTSPNANNGTVGATVSFVTV